MHILLLILKIIGIILLSIIGLVLLLLLLILFVPIRYNVKADFAPKSVGIDPNDPSGEDEGMNINAKAKVTYLLHLFSVTVSYTNSGLSTIIRILCIPINRKKDNDTNKYEKRIRKSKPKAKKHNSNSTACELKEGPDYTFDENISDEDNSTLNENHDCINIESKGNESNINDAEEQTYPFIEFIRNIYDKLLAFFHKISDAFTEIEQKKKKLDHLFDMIEDERNKNAAVLSLSAVKKILLHLAPRKIKGKLHIGMEDPDKTGSVLMYAALIYPIYKKQINIVPDFEQEIIEGNVKLRGRCIVFVPLIQLIKLYINKDFRRLLKNIRK